MINKKQKDNVLEQEYILVVAQLKTAKVVRSKSRMCIP